MSLPELMISGPVAAITLRRPLKANRLEPDDLAAICEHVEQINNDASVLVLKIQSEGKYFSSGFDISRLASECKVSFEDMVNAVEDCRAVTIARLHAGVYGGATDLALACDFRVGVRGVDTFMPAARLGLMFAPRELSRYMTRIGMDNMKRLFLTAERLGADDLLRIGFLTDLVEPHELDQHVERLAGLLAGMAPLSLMAMKKHINLWARGIRDDDSILRDMARCKHSEDMVVGMTAWATKSEPRFSGR